MVAVQGGNQITLGVVLIIDGVYIYEIIARNRYHFTDTIDK